MARTLHARAAILELRARGWHESEIARIVRFCRAKARTRRARAILDGLLDAHASMGYAS